MPDHSAMKLGRKPARFDPRVPQFARYLTARLPATPASCNWSFKVPEWKMLANDRLGDCTAAGCGHAIQTWTANASSEADITDPETISFYSETCGYDPNNPNSDGGGVELDVLSWWLKNDFAGHKLDAFAALDIGNQTNIKDAIWLTGCVYLGVNLPLSAQDQDIWDIPPEGLTGNGTPKSWGGHCVIACGYNDKGLTVITWGQPKLMTWSFYHAYVEEAWALLSKEWISASGIAPSGFLYEDLILDMAALGDTNPMDRLRDASDDPVLMEFHWRDITININQAAATWVIGLISAALATHGYLNDSTVQTWAGSAAMLFATWLHLTKIQHSNISTRQLVDAVSEIIDVLQRRKIH